ncbi:MAG: DNA-binding protein [Bacteroidetes bacterium GWF2_38_335]|nr:MAG: DNA-binding protein [Bacteroidetes bacterium GWF2_38_335]HBS88112.1 DNA-binding protein [Bacteroidales bacterium]
MDVITIETVAFTQIMAKLQSLEEKFIELKEQASCPLNEKWLDNQDVMLLLKLSKRTLQSYRDEKKIPFSQIGAKIYYRASDFDKLLKKNYQKTITNGL